MKLKSYRGIGKSLISSIFLNDINTDGKPKSHYKGSNLSVISEKVFFLGE